MTIPAGTRLGPYEVVAPVGAGGMGEVYRARDTRLGREIAVKILNGHLVDSESARRRFEQEARAVAALAHPNIVSLHDVGQEGGQFFVVTELLEGETLHDRLRRGPLPLHKLVETGAAVAEGLGAAHARGVVHRDLKPSNVFLTADGRVKVLDFGLARQRAPLDPQRAADTPTLSQTQPGTVLGTPGYMSPEQVRGEAVDARSDIFSLGCVLYEMATGHRAFSGASTAETLASIVRDEPAVLSDSSRWPSGLRAIVAHCLEKQSDQRFESARDVAFALRSLAGAQREQRAARTGAGRWWPAAALTAAMITGLGFAVAALRTPSPPAVLPEAHLEQLTLDGGLTTTPAISRDGKMLAYASDRAGGGDLDVWVQQLAGGEPLALTDDPADDHSPDFSPDGTQVAFQSERDGGGVYVVSTLGGRARLIARGGRRPRFSPDGSRIAYWSGLFRGETAGTASAAWVVALAGGEPVQVAADMPVVRDPIWAPDGRSLLLFARRSSAPGEDAGIDWWWVPLDGRAPSRAGFAEASLAARAPVPEAWSSEGVVFSDGDNLWVLPVGADGRKAGPPRRITLGPDRHVSPAVGPDGQVVFAALGGERVVERVSLEPSAVDHPPRELHRDGARVTTRASQNRDGSVIVFERSTAADRELWLKDVASGRPTFLARVRSERQLSPILSPDGSRVAYSMAGRPGEDYGSATGYVIETAGGLARKVCGPCSPSGFLSDSQRLLSVDEGGRAIRLVDMSSGASRELVVPAQGRVQRPHASPDDRLLAFGNRRGLELETYVARIPENGPAPVESWQMVQEPTTSGRPCGWSPDGRTLYLLLDADGFRCLWAQRVDPGGRLLGTPQPVRHFHHFHGGSFGTGLGDAITRDGFMYERGVDRGNIWRLLQGPGSTAGRRP